MASNQKVQSHTFITLCNCISTLALIMSTLLKPISQEPSFTMDHGPWNSHGEDKFDPFQLYFWTALDSTTDKLVHGTK